MPQKTKLIVFDLNSTLIHEDTWARLNIALGMTEAEDKVLWDLNQQNLLTNDEWVAIVNRIFMARQRATKALIEQVVFSYTYTEGAKEIIDYVKQRGYTVALISGAMDLLVKHVAAELGIEHAKWCSEFMFGEDGWLDHFTYIDSDAAAKKQLLLELCSELGIEPADTICVGDGANEAEMFGVSKGVTFEGSRLQESAWRVVPSLKALQDIL